MSDAVGDPRSELGVRGFLVAQFDRDGALRVDDPVVFVGSYSDMIHTAVSLCAMIQVTHQGG